MGLLRRQPVITEEPVVPEAVAREMAEEAYRSGMAAAFQSAATELHEQALLHRLQVPRHVLVLMAKRWSSASKEIGQDRVPGQGP